MVRDLKHKKNKILYGAPLLGHPVYFYQTFQM